MNKRTKLPPSGMLTLPTVARHFGWDVDQLEVMESIGELQTVMHEAGNKAVKVVTLEEVARLQSATVKQPERYNPSERKTALYLIGLLAKLYAWGQPHADKHYPLRDLLEGDARAKGIGMLRSKETDAVMLQEGLELVRSLEIRAEADDAEREAA